MPLPREIREGDPYDPAPIMENFDYLDRKFPLATVSVGSGLDASKLTIPTGWKLPPSAYPANTADVFPPKIVELSSDPMYVRAWGVPFARRLTAGTWPRTSGGGFPFPINCGVCIPSRTTAIVYELPNSTAGSPDALLDSTWSHTFTTGDSPVHGTCKNPNTAYVACQGDGGANTPKVKSISLGRGGGSATTVKDLTAAYTSVRNICINRSGSYLYIVAKKAGDANHRRVLRLDVAAGTLSECTIDGDHEITGVSVVNDDGASSASCGTLYITRYTSAASGGQVQYVPESTSGIYGGSFAAAPTGTVWSGGAGSVAYGSCIFRGGLSVVYLGASSAKVESAWISRAKAPQAQTGANVAHTTHVCSALTVAVKGSVCTNGHYVFFLGNGGQLMSLVPTRQANSSSGPIAVAGQISGSPGTSTDYGGIATNGLSMICNLNQDSNGNGFMLNF